MAPRRCRLGAVCFLLCAVLAASGCGFECGDFGDFDAVEVSGTEVSAAAPEADTVRVVLVGDGSWGRLEYFARVGAERPAPRNDGRFGVSFRYEGAAWATNPPAFASAVRGDTVYVYLETQFADSIFEEACSPPEPYLTVDVFGASAPEGTTRVTFEAVDVRELSASDFSFLRDTEADRHLIRLTTA